MWGTAPLGASCIPAATLGSWAHLGADYRAQNRHASHVAPLRVFTFKPSQVQLVGSVLSGE